MALSNSDTWKYLPVLNACIKILFTVGLGAVLGGSGIFGMPFVATMTKFVFQVGLPCLVVNALGVTIDFYSDKNIWRYICAFLILRAVTLVISLATLGWPRRGQGPTTTIGDVAVRWLCLSWISTVILGVPIMTSVYNNPSLGQKYGVLAAISSFIFQLPLQLFFLECHQAENQPTTGDGASRPTDMDANRQVPPECAPQSLPALNSVEILEEGNVECSSSPLGTNNVDEISGDRTAFSIDIIRGRGDIWAKIGWQVLHNPVLWGIFLGFVISLSKFGVKFLRPKDLDDAPPTPNPDYVEGLQWFVDTLVWIGSTVSPVSLFAMGVWMQQQGRRLINISFVRLGLFMVSKLVMVPLLMLGLSHALNLDNEQTRSAVLIATLPISLASFSLGKKYEIGEDVLSANVAVGTILMLPTVIIWNAVLDNHYD